MRGPTNGKARLVGDGCQLNQWHMVIIIIIIIIISEHQVGVDLA